MGIFPNADQAMRDNPRLDTIARFMIAVGGILTSIGTKIVQSRNELLTEALAEQEDRIGAAYRAGRLDERAGLPDLDADEDQGDEDQGDEDQGDEAWLPAPGTYIANADD